jgi:hypothetical protein
METINRGWAPEAGGRVLYCRRYGYILIKQLQETAKKAAEEAALPEDSQEGQEDDNISNLSDEKPSDEEPELISDIWGLTR